MGVFDLILVIACVTPLTAGEMFTAMAELEAALYAEHDVADVLKMYIKSEEERLNKLKRTAEEFEAHSNYALENPDKNIANPVDAFLFVKKFTLDWDRDVAILFEKNTTQQGLLQRIEYHRQALPSDEDLLGAVAALMRLQDTYQLDTAKLAQGDINGIQASELTADACFEIGRVSYMQEDYRHTEMWMRQALRSLPANPLAVSTLRAEILDYLAFTMYKDCYILGRYAYNSEDFYHTYLWMQAALMKEPLEQNKTVSRSEVLDYCAFATSRQGNVRHALSLTKELLSLDPDHERARNNKVYYEQMIQDEEKKSGKRGDDGEVPIKNERQVDEYRKSAEFIFYEALCRGEDIMEVRDRHRLTCRWETNNKPLLMIQPAKLEEVHLKPWIVLYHGLLSDQEIETIKKIALPRLHRATVNNAVTGKLETASYRVSKSAWLQSSEHRFIDRVVRRIEAVTGLNMDTAEELQVANYGLGGHYEPHFDFSRKHEEGAFKSLGTGNRLATMLNYMSDVEAGGATVFPRIGVKLFPKKGVSAFWYNLYRSGEGIENTRHAACPVLVGTKWVSTKWIHERGQEFRRKCSLDPNE